MDAPHPGTTACYVYTAVLKKVVPQKGRSVRDNVQRYYGSWWLRVS